MHRSRFRLLAATLLSVMLPASASAGPESVYEGVVGTARVVVAITEDKGEVDGHYFYQRARLDIDLSGTADGTTLNLAWALSEKGLWLGAYFARVQRACDAPDWAVIPWSALGLPRGEQA